MYFYVKAKDTNLRREIGGKLPGNWHSEQLASSPIPRCTLHYSLVQSLTGISISIRCDVLAE